MVSEGLINSNTKTQTPDVRHISFYIKTISCDTCSCCTENNLIIKHINIGKYCFVNDI